MVAASLVLENEKSEQKADEEAKKEEDENVKDAEAVEEEVEGSVVVEAEEVTVKADAVDEKEEAKKKESMFITSTPKKEAKSSTATINLMATTPLASTPFGMSMPAINFSVSNMLPPTPRGMSASDMLRTSKLSLDNHLSKSRSNSVSSRTHVVSTSAVRAASPALAARTDGESSKSGKDATPTSVGANVTSSMPPIITITPTSIFSPTVSNRIAANFDGKQTNHGGVPASLTRPPTYGKNAPSTLFAPRMYNPMFTPRGSHGVVATNNAVVTTKIGDGKIAKSTKPADEKKNEPNYGSVAQFVRAKPPMSAGPSPDVSGNEEKRKETGALKEDLAKAVEKLDDPSQEDASTTEGKTTDGTKTQQEDTSTEGTEQSVPVEEKKDATVVTATVVTPTVVTASATTPVAVNATTTTPSSANRSPSVVKTTTIVTSRVISSTSPKMSSKDSPNKKTVIKACNMPPTPRGMQITTSSSTSTGS